MQAEEMKAARATLKLSIRKLARALGTWPSAIQRWETGKSEIPPYIALAIEAVLKRQTEPPRS